MAIGSSSDSLGKTLLSSALLACEIKLDVDSVASALLHDVIEDCGITKGQISRRFGRTVADLVDGVTSH